MKDQPAGLARRVKAIDEALPLDRRRDSRAIGRKAREVDGGGVGVEASGGADHGLVNSFGAPDKVSAVLDGKEARGEFAGADHRGKNDFVAIVNAISGYGNSFERGGHDGDITTEKAAEQNMLFRYNKYT